MFNAADVVSAAAESAEDSRLRTVDDVYNDVRRR